MEDMWDCDCLLVEKIYHWLISVSITIGFGFSCHWLKEIDGIIMHGEFHYYFLCFVL